MKGGHRLLVHRDCSLESQIDAGCGGDCDAPRVWKRGTFLMADHVHVLLFQMPGTRADIVSVPPSICWSNSSEQLISLIRLQTRPAGSLFRAETPLAGDYTRVTAQYARARQRCFQRHGVHQFRPGADDAGAGGFKTEAAASRR